MGSVRLLTNNITSLLFNRLEATSDELFNSASTGSVAVPDKSQGAKMDQSITLFTQGQPSHPLPFYSYSLTPLSLTCQLGDKWLTGGIAGAKGLTDRGVQRLTLWTLMDRHPPAPP